tara:strand:+ start:3730 stop:3924 length:195 start_codon:yes stop_codon:yes gene_type:complete
MDNLSKKGPKPDSNELALFSCLRYEEANLKHLTDYEQRWNITDKERQVVLKWMANRMEDIKERT